MPTAGAVLTMISLFVGEYAQTGWLAYPPLSGIAYSTNVGVDYYIWGLQIAGVGTTLSGINLVVTILKLRAPGMGLMKMPVFTWTRSDERREGKECVSTCRSRWWPIL